MRAFWVCAGLAVLCLAPPLRADEPKKAEAKTYQVPYRLTKTQHILVRAKINGKGPFNFILDTGAPALFVTTAVSKKVGVEPDKMGWGMFDRVELEGGVVIEKAKGRVEDVFQLQGMNALGLAGLELHGVIGYNILARYRTEYDLTKDKLGFTPLNFDPPAPEALKGVKGGPSEIEIFANLFKMLGPLLKDRLAQPIEPRGFLGIELADSANGVTVTTVLEGSPAAKAGLKAGDQLSAFAGKKVKTTDEVHKLAAELTAGQTANLTITRGTETKQITVKTGEGL